MASLKADFDELLERISRGRALNDAGFDPVYYLVFSPRQILDVKRIMPAWMARLHNDGLQVVELSVADIIYDFIGSVKLRKFWLAADEKAPLDWDRTNQSLANALTKNDIILKAIESELAELEHVDNAMLVVTDLEALHPYIRIGTIENRLQGQFKVPTIFLYPGTRVGTNRLKFLGFYPEDGNYRSVHVGG